jgi:hypothetical protein
MENFSSSPPRFFYTPKNPIFALLKNSVRRNRNFSNEKFRFLETKVEFQGKKQIRFIEIEFFMKGKTGNSGGEKETWGAGREICSGFYGPSPCQNQG